MHIMVNGCPLFWLSWTLWAYLDSNCSGWENRPVDLRLRQLGRRTVTFSHQGGSISGGVVQLLESNPHDALFYYENAWISVATYFYVRYGETVSSINRIAFAKIVPDLEEYGDEPMLYPLDFLEIY